MPGPPELVRTPREEPRTPTVWSPPSACWSGRDRCGMCASNPTAGREHRLVAHSSTRGR